MTENEKTINLLKTTLDVESITDQIENKKREINEIYLDLLPALDDLDMVFELDKFKKAFEELVKIHHMESYRAGFKAGVLLFTQ